MPRASEYAELYLALYANGVGRWLDSQMRTFTFDAAGNMTEKKVVTDSAVVTETRTFNDLNEITQNVIVNGGTTTWTYTHDDAGNMTAKNDGSDYWVYVWDEDNRLVEVELNSNTLVTYEYDSVGRLLKRVEGSLTTKFEWDGWDLVREVKSGSVSETTDYYVPEGGVHSFKRGGSIHHVHFDALGSAQMVTDPNGDPVASLVYGAWGEVLDETESISGDLDVAFVGGLGVRRDQTTGLVLMRNRWYHANVGRFINRDPIRQAGGLNLYAYAESNPARNVDPFGLDISDWARGWFDALSIGARWFHGNRINPDYFEGSLQVRDLQGSRGVDLARRYYFDKNGASDNCFNDEPLTGYGVDFDFPGGLLETNGTLHLLGSHNIDISPRPDGMVRIEVYNTLSTASLFRLPTRALEQALALPRDTLLMPENMFGVHGRNQEIRFSWTEPRPTVGGHDDFYRNSRRNPRSILTQIAQMMSFSL